MSPFKKIVFNVRHVVCVRARWMVYGIQWKRRQFVKMMWAPRTLTNRISFSSSAITQSICLSVSRIIRQSNKITHHTTKWSSKIETCHNDIPLYLLFELLSHLSHFPIYNNTHKHGTIRTYITPCVARLQQEQRTAHTIRKNEKKMRFENIGTYKT